MAEKDVVVAQEVVKDATQTLETAQADERTAVATDARERADVADAAAVVAEAEAQK